MPDLPPISATQSTVPSVNASTATDASAWANALASTQASPQNNTQGVANAPASPNHTGGKKKETNQPQAEAISGTSGLTVEHSKTTKTAKIQIVYTLPQQSKDTKKDAHQAAAIVAPAMQAQPVAEKPPITSNAKTPSQTVHKTNCVTSLVNTNATATSPNPTPQNNSNMTAKAIPEIATSSQGSNAAPAQTAAKTETAAAPAPPATNAQAGVAEMPAAANSSKRATSATMQNAGSVGSSKTPVQPTASQPVTASTAQVLTARAAQLYENMLILPKEKEKISNPQITTLNGANTNIAEFSAASTGSTVTHTNAEVENTSTAPAALAATVTALHQSGQTGTVLRLDPPGLGHLAVEVRLGTQGQVNVLFVPSTADAAQALHASLPGLGTAMTQSGLTLGQAQVGGQFSQQSGQNGQGGYTPPRQNNATSFAAEPHVTPSGLSAYA